MADENDTADAVDESIVAPDAADEANEPVELSEVEQLASEMGWTPKDQWTKDESDWKPAKDFLIATKDINRSLSRDVKDLKKQVDRISSTSAAMTERAIAEARSKWEAQLDQAVDDGDKEAVKKANAELAKLDKAVTPDLAPEGQDFAEKHASWFGKDTEATNYAVNRAGYYADQGLSPARQLKAVEKDMREMFPDLLEPEKQPQKPQPSVAAPTTRAARPAPREKGYATLPPEARKACDAWVKANAHRGAYATKDTWASSYYEDQEAANG